jgi:hypothetical protein
MQRFFRQTVSFPWQTLLHEAQGPGVASNEVGEQSTAYDVRGSARLTDGFSLSPRPPRRIDRIVAACRRREMRNPRHPTNNGLATFRAGHDAN